METELNRTVFFAVIAFSGTVFTDTLADLRSSHEVVSHDKYCRARVQRAWSTDRQGHPRWQCDRETCEALKGCSD